MKQRALSETTATRAKRTRRQSHPAQTAKAMLLWDDLINMPVKFSNMSNSLLICCVLYSIYLAILPSPGISLASDELFSVFSYVFGLVIGSYSAFYMSNWWSTRLATGAAAGAVADTAMILIGYLRQVESSVTLTASKSGIADNLKIAYLYHLIEVNAFGSATSELLTNDPKCENLIETLSFILGEVTLLSESVSFSDSVKFSLLPSVQANLSSLRSGAGDCTMMLSSRYPVAFRNIVFGTTLGYLMYLPMFLMGKSDPPIVNLACLSACLAISGFLILIETTFKNPFAYDSFGIKEIMRSTFDVVNRLYDNRVNEYFFMSVFLVQGVKSHFNEPTSYVIGNNSPPYGAVLMSEDFSSRPLDLAVDCGARSCPSVLIFSGQQWALLAWSTAEWVSNTCSSIGLAWILALSFDRMEDPLARKGSPSLI